MQLNKLFGAIAITALTAAIAMGQSARLSIHLAEYTGEYSSVADLTALGAGAPNSLTFNTSDFGAYIPVKVTVRFQAINHTGSLGISIINTYIRFSNGVTVAQFDPDGDEGGNTDDRKNANSHSRGNSAIDGAGNGTYSNNSARWYDPTAPGGPVQGPLAAGKSIYTTPFTGTTSQPLYSFVVWVPNVVGVYDIFFARPFSGAPANTDPTLKTNILGNSPQGQPVQYTLVSNLIDGRVEVVPEPASMIALGSGLVGLLALRRRRQA
jgi:hypothetical protein